MPLPFWHPLQVTLVDRISGHSVGLDLLDHKSAGGGIEQRLVTFIVLSACAVTVIEQSMRFNPGFAEYSRGHEVEVAVKGIISPDCSCSTMRNHCHVNGMV